MQGESSRRWLGAVLSGAALLGLACLVGPRATDPAPFGDPLVYLRMAGWQPDGPTGDSHVPFPFAHRILTPALARLLPLHLTHAFLFVTLLALGAFLALLHRLARQLDLDDRAAWLSVAVALTLFYPTLYTLHKPFLPDALHVALWTGALLAALERRPLLFVTALAIGTFNKEAVLLVALAAALVWGRESRPRPIVAVPVIAGALYVLAFAATRGETPHAGVFAAGWVRSTFTRDDLFQSLLFGFLRAGAPLWGLLLLRWRDLTSLERRLLVAGGVSVAPLLVVANDAGRQLGLLAPFWIPTFARLATASGAAPLGLALAGNLVVALAPFLAAGHAGKWWNAAGGLMLLAPSAVHLLARGTWAPKPGADGPHVPGSNARK